jgi:hypothetical protein
LGEFWLFRGFFTLGEKKIITQVAQIFRLISFRGKSYVLILAKRRLGYILGDFSHSCLITLS